mgnify:CR=1 FL=1
MAYREVMVVELREVLRRWVSGHGYRATARQTGVDRKTIRRYVEHAKGLGVERNGDDSQLTDALLGRLLGDRVPGRVGIHGEACPPASHDRSVTRTDDGCTPP